MSIVNGILESNGIKLRGTSAYYINSNLRTQNRNPVDQGFSNILCVIPITKAENAIETYIGDVSFQISDRILNYVLIELLDDDMKPIEFNGAINPQ